LGIDNSVFILALINKFKKDFQMRGENAKNMMKRMGVRGKFCFPSLNIGKER
jgi:hypothetical protein